MLRMDEFRKIRKEFHVNGKSIYQIAKEYRRSWSTVKTIVAIPEHKIQNRGERPSRKALVITPEVEKRINELIEHEEIKKVPRKQRFTATYIFKKLTDEGIYKGSSKRIRTVVKHIRADRSKRSPKVFLQLTFEFAQYLQVDHGEAEVDINGVRMSGYLFTSSVPGQQIRFCQFYFSKASECWGHFHEKAFIFLGGTHSKVMYDNDSVLKNNQKNKPTDFCLELQTHYKFEAVFCNKAAGWEKGSVENTVGFCRRNFLAGVPSFKKLEELNQYLWDQCQNKILNDNHTVIKKPLYEIHNEIKIQLRPFHPGRQWGFWEDFRVNSFQQITFKGHAYSVPEMYVGATLKTFISANDVTIYDSNEIIYTHARKYFELEDSLILDHYLDQLIKKPRAIRHAKVILEHTFPTFILELQRRLYHKYDEKTAGINFIQTLMLQRVSSAEDFNTAVQLALVYEAISHTAVKSILEQLQISTTHELVRDDFPKIDHHFNLDKYQNLEQHYD